MTLARLSTAAALMLTALPLAAQETRQMDAHVHGTGELLVAIEGTTVAMDITVPGADIVGFEHAPGSDADRAALDAALARFDTAFALFTIEGDAGCTAVTTVNHTHGYGIADDHDDHGHDDHAHDDHDHGHETEAAHGHDDHGHDDHAHAAEAGHDDHDHDHAGDSHAEFHATYELTCTDPAAITAIAFPYFDLFENARELDVQIVSDTGAMAVTVLRDAPRLSLVGAM